MPGRFAIEPQNKLNTFWECNSNTTRPTRMTRSTLLRQRYLHATIASAAFSPARQHAIRQVVETRCTAALEFVVAVTCPTVSNAPQQSSQHWSGEHGTVADTRQKNRTYPETNMCSQRISTTIRKVQQQRQQPFQPTESERTTVAPIPSSARQQRRKSVSSS